MGFSSVTDANHSPSANITVSLVSHGQGALALDAIKDLIRCPEVAHIVLTVNIPEDVPNDLSGGSSKKITVLRNSSPKGFGQNHNNAFACCSTELFCILNPDVRLSEDTFTCLRRLDSAATGAALVSPVVLNTKGAVEDSARRFPTPLGLLLRVMRISQGTYDAPIDCDFEPEWVAGMFMLLPSQAFRSVGGFDQEFFMYCEDIDLCLRLYRNGLRIIRSSEARIIHDARRTSHRNMRYLAWHMGSLLTLWRKHPARMLGWRASPASTRIFG
jgi:N-acetylglucosaminyl-diphospho-decaprenol L-rhamnosyltransferase